MSVDINMSAPLSAVKERRVPSANFTPDQRNKRRLFKRAGRSLAKLPRLFKESED
jgi:hypothetical protein